MSSTPAINTTLEIETPESIRLSMRLAGPGSRFLAFGIDLVIKGALVSALVLVTVLAKIGVDVSGLPHGLLLLGSFVIDWGYGTLFEGFGGGRTPGKAALNLRVVRTGGYPIGFQEAVLRNLLRIADSLPAFYGVGLVVMFLNRRMQRLGDILADSVVVWEPRRKLEAMGHLTIEALPWTPELKRNRPPERTLEVIERLLARRRRLSVGRAEELAGILAGPLAIQLGQDPGRQPEKRPTRMEFLERVLVTFTERARASTSRSGRVANPPPSPGGQPGAGPGRPEPPR